MEEKKYHFIDKDGTFTLKQAENYSYLYFPIAGETGIKSCVTPNLAGDSKIDQNQFLLEPVSAENLHNNRSSRNFWCHIDGVGNWSAVGNSAEQINNRFTPFEEKSEVTAGLMWHTAIRESQKYLLRATVTSFVPLGHSVEIMHVKITNIGKISQTMIPTAAIPIYGRSAANIRDHRHVTSLLHRIRTIEEGVEVKPTLSFDERGHQMNDITYFVYGVAGDGTYPTGMFPTVEEYLGEGGNYEHPGAVVQKLQGVKAGVTREGMEAVGALQFSPVTLQMEESVSYTILLGASKKEIDASKLMSRYDTEEKVMQELQKVKKYWKNMVNVSYETSNTSFDCYMKWVSFQPVLRRIYGCSFLPHHDYGKGGRGWRDLWQDCLALLIMNPSDVRQMLLDNFAGVRMDGTNATIIGEKQGEFVADRNDITRVWMDHGVWPWMTTKFYLDQTGDLALLLECVNYFKDRQVMRGRQTDDRWTKTDSIWQQDEQGDIYQGTILEHLLIQNLTSFYEVGEHNEILLRDADWNDALDMASHRGESVAFTNAYAGNLRELADIIRTLGVIHPEVKLAKEIAGLLVDDELIYESVEKKQDCLKQYATKCMHRISGEQITVKTDSLADGLVHKADWMMNHIRQNEWVTDEEGHGWFNGYYDDHGNRVEGVIDGQVRMMLTSQVFSVMAGTATDEQTRQIAKSADRYLYDAAVGGYRLNTNFYEQKMDMGRMFGFSYGDKENGAVFSHMAVMYGNAMYRRGFVKEGYKALYSLAHQALDFETSKIYPGIPEYFNGRGRGMYHYLTGAASWYMMTVITQMFGVRGRGGDLILMPKLLAEQFNIEGRATIRLEFAGKKWSVSYHNTSGAEYGSYHVVSLALDGHSIACQKDSYAVITREQISKLDELQIHTLEIELQ